MTCCACTAETAIRWSMRSESYELLPGMMPLDEGKEEVAEKCSGYERHMC